MRVKDICVINIILFGIICLSSCLCRNNKTSSPQIYAYHLETEPAYYLFQSDTEWYNIFLIGSQYKNVEELCKNLNIMVDTVIPIPIDTTAASFDTLYYSNYSIEQIVFNSMDFTITENTCTVKVVDPFYKKGIYVFHLSTFELRFLSSLLSEVITHECKESMLRSLTDDNGIDMYFGIMMDGKRKDIYISDSSPCFNGSIELLNSFIICLSNKYCNINNKTDTIYEDYSSAAYLFFDNYYFHGL